MEPSRKNNVSATAAVILLLVFVAAEMARPVGAKRAACSHLSGKFSGACTFDYDCAVQCLDESPDNTGGACDDFPGRCYCQTQCPP
ncbi:unnamed protein product [Urochloa decumbens]|uniref:Knottins-like domain-containing protein n=1 Tax=Urochloa decumbens TaxID=240449 RepID=A0ABC9BS30_9POAL